MDVLHTAIEVADLDSMRSFYEGLLGLEHSRDYVAGGTRNYYVVGSGRAEIQFRVVDEKPEPAGINHIAMATDDMDTVVERRGQTAPSRERRRSGRPTEFSTRDRRSMGTG